MSNKHNKIKHNKIHKDKYLKIWRNKIKNKEDRYKFNQWYNLITKKIFSMIKLIEVCLKLERKLKSRMNRKQTKIKYYRKTKTYKKTKI
jgi:hypothetical protein